MINKKKRLQTLLGEVNIEASSDALEKYLLLLNELSLWNKRFNLTAITDPEEAMEKHIVDSLTLYPLLQQSEFLLDIGSGAGFPSIPLQVALPKLKFFRSRPPGKRSIFNAISPES